MKTIRVVLTAITLLIATSLMAQVDKKAYNVDDSKIALQGYSSVSYLDLNLAQRGVKEFKTEYQGVLYYFTNAEQKAKFDKNPKKYMPQYGGYCAFGVYAGAKFRVDPNKFLVSNGKLYLFLNNVELDAKQLWLAENESTLVKKANGNWSNLKNTQ